MVSPFSVYTNILNAFSLQNKSAFFQNSYGSKITFLNKGIYTMNIKVRVCGRHGSSSSLGTIPFMGVGGAYLIPYIAAKIRLRKYISKGNGSYNFCFIFLFKNIISQVVFLL